MGQTTKISWTDHTFNPWIGCTKVSTGCEHCYAETQNKRYNWAPDGWGSGKPRKRTSAANWRKPLEWGKKALSDGVVRRVFCASLADVFDIEVDPQWRSDLFGMIDQVDHATSGTLEWLILTKRPENIAGMLPTTWLMSPPPFVRIGVTAENQSNADKRIPPLLREWKGRNFVSYEPALGPVNFWRWLPDSPVETIDWVICGGESGTGCRAMDLSWARDVRNQCSAAKVLFFFKQIGGFPNKGDEPAKWPEDLKIQEFPEVEK